MANNSDTQFLLNPIGSGGDVYPCIPIAEELLRRGHDVRVLSNPMFRSLFTDRGVRFADIGRRTDLERLAQSVDLNDSRSAWRAALRWGAVGTMRETYQKLMRCYRQKRTVIVHSPIGFGARIASERNQIPCATLAFSPFTLRTFKDSPICSPLWLGPLVPGFAKAIQWKIVDRLLDRVVERQTNKFRSELDLPPISRFMNGWNLSPDLILGIFPKLMVKSSTDFPDQFRIVGQVNWSPDGDARRVSEALQFAGSGAPPILVLSGSVGFPWPEFYQQFFRVCRKLGQRIILVERNDLALPSEVPEHVFHINYLQLSKVLPHCKAILHSGGIGTVAQCLQMAVPQIILPMVNDQADNARRVARSGTGIVLKLKKFDATAICRGLKQVFSDEQLKRRCQEVALKMSSEDGVGEACDLLEAILPPRPVC